MAIDDRFGEPVDAYVNGSQVWLRDDAPGEVAVEWRLHPVPGYRKPKGVSVYELFPMTAVMLREGREPPAPLDQLWSGLEAFAAYGDEVEPAALRAACTDALGIAPDAAGLVDHKALGDRWEHTPGGIDLVAALLAELHPQ